MGKSTPKILPISGNNVEYYKQNTQKSQSNINVLPVSLPVLIKKKDKEIILKL